ncbi:MAG: energy transducer TonB, partial [Candidatus Cryptobacteroides sp.]|nr:energy transducer TonB [Candidatus Cryptobacteroides sp.]
SDISESLKAGHAMGNTPSGKTTGEPNAHLKGRHVLGNIQRPEYNVQESGIVVVTISVDRYGNVIKAVPGADGTTVTDKNLWTAARKAAMETHFSQKSDAPEQQQGTITYIFNLK